MAKFQGATFLVALFLFQVLPWSSPRQSWFKADGPVGSAPRSFMVTVSSDSIPVYIGNQRRAPEYIKGQTFRGMQYTFEASYQGKDTAFWWHAVLLCRAQGASPIPEPVWASVVRGGRGENEWSRMRFQETSKVVEFHSPIYGDGQHPLESGVLPEEILYPLAMTLASGTEELHFRVYAPAWEQPYTRKNYAVKGFRTGQRLKIDDVEAVLVRFEREDGADAEYWVSVSGLRVLRARTFRGLLFERIQ